MVKSFVAAVEALALPLVELVLEAAAEMVIELESGAETETLAVTDDEEVDDVDARAVTDPTVVRVKAALAVISPVAVTDTVHSKIVIVADVD